MLLLLDLFKNIYLSVIWDLRACKSKWTESAELILDLFSGRFVKSSKFWPMTNEKNKFNYNSNSN